MHRYFCGVSGAGTLGHTLLNGASEVKLFGEEIQVRAQILNLPGISGHADREHLTAWCRAWRSCPDGFLSSTGEDAVTDGFAAHLTEVTGVEATAPYSGDIYDLLRNACVVYGSRKRVEKKAKKRARSAVFDRLLAAGSVCWL